MFWLYLAMVLSAYFCSMLNMRTKLLSLKEINKITDYNKLKQVKISGAFFIAWILIYFSIIKWLGCEIDHWPPSSTEVKNEWSSTSAQPTCLHDKDNFTFYIYIVMRLFTQTIPVFVFFVKVKPTLHLHAYIIKEIQYCYAEVIYIYKAVQC